MAKTIIITGANGNLGTATVAHFLNQGYRVIAVDHGRDHLGFAEGNPLYEWQVVDLSNEAAVSAFVATCIAEHSRIEGVLLLAGGFAMGDIQTTDRAQLQKMYSLNFETAYFMARPLFQHMVEQGYGRLVFIGARTALKAAQGRNSVAYALTKSLLFGLADLMNAEAKGHNVVASVVVPSIIDTEWNRKNMPDADPASCVSPSQIAEILEFICSDKSLPLREPVYKVYNNA